MRILGIGLREAVFCLIVLVCNMLLGHAAMAQVVTTSPASLSFGVPTLATASAEQSITVFYSGVSSENVVTLSGFGTTDTHFAITSNTCPTTAITASGSCSVGVTFTPPTSLIPGILYPGALVYTSSTQPAQVNIPLSAAVGAIKIFDETNLGASQTGSSSSNPVKYGSKTINLSCPADAVPTAVLSNTPDGKGNVLEDNYLVVAVNGVAAGGTPAGNVCPAGIADPVNDCFTHAYQDYAGGSQHNGVNTDTITNANNGITADAGGVPPINIASLFNFGSTLTPVTFTLFDEGVIVAGSTLFLQTNCSTAGIAPGGSITSNPVDPTIPSSLVPQFPFSTTQNNNIVAALDYSGNAGAQGQPVTTPTVTDVGISQSQFAQLVANTHAGPAVCLRLNAETAPDGTILCKGFLIECTVAGSSAPLSGSNCPQSLSDIEIKFQTKFDSPDALNNGLNYLPDGFNPTGSACSFYLGSATNGKCAPGTGPGLLEGSDSWFTENETSFSNASCVFPGGEQLSGALCPQNPITAFRGAQDPGHTVTTKNTNSLFVPVVNMPLPTDIVAVAGQNANGWVKTSGNVGVTFVANPATYPAPPNPPLIYPSANGFTPASIQSETYGYDVSTAPIPDPNGTNSNDTAIANSTACRDTAPAGATAFTPPVVTLNLAEGIYNLHHYPTDCAGTKGLVYKPTQNQLTDPNANWASFPVTPIGVDTTAPTFTCGSPSGTLGPNGYITNVTVACTVTDPNVFGSGFAPAIHGIQGSSTELVNLTTSVATGSYNSSASTNSATACDLAGNCVTLPAMGPFVVDLLGKADLDITAGSLSPSTVKGGTLITYAVIATNYGPNKAQGVSITDVLPAGATFSSGYILNGFSLANCTGTTTVTCPIGNLNKGGVVLAFITIKAPSTPGTATSKIAIGSLNPDAAPADNSVVVTTKVK